MTVDYRVTETGLRRILGELGGTLEAREAQEAQEFLDAGEYGLALETICSALKRSQRPLAASTRDSIVDLGERMNVDPTYWREFDYS